MADVLISESGSELGGFKEVIFEISTILLCSNACTVAYAFLLVPPTTVLSWNGIVLADEFR